MNCIFISGDHAAHPLIEHIINYLGQKHRVQWLKPEINTDGRIDYPDAAAIVCEKMSTQTKGILICGSGIGVCMAANRYQHIRAALCHEPYSAELSRNHNDANVLCLGARLIGFSMAEKIVDTFLNATFDAGRHQKRVEKFSGQLTV